MVIIFQNFYWKFIFARLQFLESQLIIPFLYIHRIFKIYQIFRRTDISVQLNIFLLLYLNNLNIYDFIYNTCSNARRMLLSVIKEERMGETRTDNSVEIAQSWMKYRIHRHLFRPVPCSTRASRGNWNPALNHDIKRTAGRKAIN